MASIYGKEGKSFIDPCTYAEAQIQALLTEEESNLPPFKQRWGQTNRDIAIDRDTLLVEVAKEKLCQSRIENLARLLRLYAENKPFSEIDASEKFEKHTEKLKHLLAEVLTLPEDASDRLKLCEMLLFHGEQKEKEVSGMKV